jgi:hypothetical protein
MKTQYNIKDQVWIHIGERKLVGGRVVDIITLTHLNENHDPDRELYIIELETGIEDIYEVRTFDEISPDAKGPINLFRNNKTRMEQRYLKKIGVILPNEGNVISADGYVEPELPMILEDEEPTQDQIHAAMERHDQSVKHAPLNLQKENKSKRRYFKKKKPL